MARQENKGYSVFCDKKYSMGVSELEIVKRISGRFMDSPATDFGCLRQAWFITQKPFARRATGLALKQWKLCQSPFT